MKKVPDMRTKDRSAVLGSSRASMGLGVRMLMMLVLLAGAVAFSAVLLLA